MSGTEYGARLKSGLLYLHDFNENFVRRFVTDMAPITPIHLVRREWVAGVHTEWEKAA